ncbi:MAG: glycoside hydrolase family 27 protein [Bacteroidales bacterium]|nr:glycoside hydrolase family 27 protein [Bacteroidales bacterium]
MKRILFIYILAVVVVGCKQNTTQHEKLDLKSLAQTPPMGWNSFDAYDSRINEEEFKANVDVFAEKLKPHGWEYVVVDYLWFHPYPGKYRLSGKRFGHGDLRYAADGAPIDTVAMDEYGRLLPHPDRFPSASGGAGFKALADYVHAKGLKFGIHIMRGIHRQAVFMDSPILGTEYTARDIAETFDTCKWSNHMYGVDATKPGAQEYYNSLFKMYANWGVDFVKADDMMVPPFHDGEINMMWKAIENSGRPMVLSLSCGEAPISKAEFLTQNSHMWRISVDFWDDWEDIVRNFELLNAWSPFIGEGQWPDADMIPFGHISLNGRPRGEDRQSKLTWNEHYTLMTLWCIARSPLMIGSDLLSSSDTSLSFFMNDDVLAVNQNSTSNHQVYRTRNKACWIAEVPGTKNYYLALFNLDDQPHEIEFIFEYEGIRGDFVIKDLWANKNLGTYNGSFKSVIQEHGAGLYLMTRTN